MWSYWNRQFLRVHIWSKIRVVGYPKIIKMWDNHLCCRNGYKKDSFPTYEWRQSRRLYKKNIFWDFIFGLELVLWVIQKHTIQILDFPELLFFLDWDVRVSKSKNGAWWDVYFSMLIFRLFFILADKISRFAKFWISIQNLNSVAVVEIPYLNRRCDFVTFLRDFCQNSWTSSLCADLKNYAFCINIAVLWTRRTISSILGILDCIFSL